MARIVSTTLLIALALCRPVAAEPVRNPTAARTLFSSEALARAVRQVAPAPIQPPPPRTSHQGAWLQGMLIGGAVGASFGMLVGYQAAESGDRGRAMFICASGLGVVGAAIGGQLGR